MYAGILDAEGWTLRSNKDRVADMLTLDIIELGRWAGERNVLVVIVSNHNFRSLSLKRRDL